MADRNREAIVAKIQEIAERVGSSAGIEIAGVELLGGGRARLLRIFIDKLPGGIDKLPGGIDKPPGGSIDKPEGVTHADCEFVSQQVGTILDVEDVMPGGSYTLEVSSPGVERKFSRPQEFERFVGKKVKIVLRQPVENQRHWVGALKSFAEGIVTLEPSPGRSVQFPLDQVEKANLKFEW